MDRPKSRLAPVLIVAGIVLPMLYVLGYVYGSDLIAATDGTFRQRLFSSKWKCVIYTPAALAEARIVGSPEVDLYYAGLGRYVPYD